MEAAIFVYFANMFGSMQPVLSFLSFLSGLLVLLFTTIFLVTKCSDPYLCSYDSTEYKQSKIQKHEDQIELMKTCSKISSYVFGVFLFLSFVIPSKETMYIMAGAWMGQQVVTSDVAKDSYQIIELELKDILNKKKAEILKPSN